MEIDNKLMMFKSGSVGKGVSQPPNQWTQMEKVEDEASGFRRYVEDYGDAGDAGKQFGECQSNFSQWREVQMKATWTLGTLRGSWGMGSSPVASSQCGSECYWQVSKASYCE